MDADHGIFGRICAFDREGTLALLRGDPELARERDPHLGSTALIFAAHRGQIEVVEALLAAGADVHARERASDSTALHWAAEAGQITIAGRLLEAGARLDPRDGWFGLTPLAWTTVVDWAPGFRSDRAGTAVLLRQHGASMDVFTAAAGNDAAVLEQLLRADPRAWEARLGFVGDEATVLHVAVERRAPEAVDLLLRRGADASARTRTGLTPLALARRVKDEGLVRRLRAAGAQDDPSSALFAGDLARVGDAGPDLASRLLHVAAAANFPEAVPTLLEAGADPALRLRTLRGEVPDDLTARDVAELHDHTDVVTALSIR